MSSKAPFDKNKMRKKKYKNAMGNAEEGHGFINMKKEKVVKAYKKLLKKEQKKSGTENQPFQVSNSSFGSPRAPIPSKKTDKKKAEMDAKLKDKQDNRRTQLERQEALNEYTKKKKVDQKLLHKKTFKGQPNMSKQMEFLLKKIENNVKNGF